MSNINQDIAFKNKLEATLTSILLSQLKEDHLISNDIKPFWTNKSKILSDKLWLPNQTRGVKSVLNSSNEILKNKLMGKSWFSIKNRHYVNDDINSFKLSNFSLPDFSKTNINQFKCKPEIKTLKIRLFPNTEEKIKLQLMLDQSRWYYNGIVSCFYSKYKTMENILKKNEYSFFEIRDLLSDYDFFEEKNEHKTLKIFKKRINDSKRQKDEIALMNKEDTLYVKKPKLTKDEKKKVKEEKQKAKEIERLRTIDMSKEEIKLEKKNKKKEKLLNRTEEDKKQENEKKTARKIKKEDNEIFFPYWWENNLPHSRLPRGSAKKFSQNINSAISNFNNGNIKEFKLKFRSRKEPTQFMLFEDSNFPKFIKNIKSNYWYTRNDKTKIKTCFLDIFNQSKNEKGFEIVYEKETDRYFLHYSVDKNFYPKEDRRSDNQVKYVYKGERIISLDPGVRKFLVGYNPKGKMVFIGKDASKEITNLLLEVDKNPSYLLWKKIKNMVNELHWKTISFLIENYDVIILPEFPISKMLKTKKITKMTKRLLQMFSFHSFKQKLGWKCCLHNKKLYIVNESYTSKTCTSCGTLNNVGGSESYFCCKCKLAIDRDVLGARNIFIKNVCSI